MISLTIVWRKTKTIVSCSVPGGTEFPWPLSQDYLRDGQQYQGGRYRPREQPRWDGHWHLCAGLAAGGVTVVEHSSGALIATGSGGYIAGTIGTAATSIAGALTATAFVATAVVSVVAVGGAVFVAVSSRHLNSAAIINHVDQAAYDRIPDTDDNDLRD